MVVTEPAWLVGSVQQEQKGFPISQGFRPLRRRCMMEPSPRPSEPCCPTQPNAPIMIKPLTPEQFATFHRDGYVILRGYFDQEETDLLIRYAKGDAQLLAKASPVLDAAGRQSKLNLWNHPGDDLYGLFSRSRRVVDGAEQLLGEEVYHWHSKMMLKEPRVGGAWEWHQDFGYWYLNGVLAPHLVSCMLAVDRASKANGCLQVLKGSHTLGRLEHGRFGEQTGADPARVAAAMKRFELVHFEAEPGDVLFFHSNTLHASAANTSEHPRWSLIMTYNTRSNTPFAESSHPEYTPLTKVDDQAIKAWGRDPQRVTKASSLLLEQAAG